jgi:preprotein translocase subunit SecA
MNRDRIGLLLSQRTARHADIGSAYFYVADADALHREFTAKGISSTTP